MTRKTARLGTRSASDGPDEKTEVRSSKFEDTAGCHGSRPRIFELRPSNFALRFGPWLALGLFIAAAQMRCGPFPSGGVPVVGVTTGGAEDIAYARQIIENGDIPDPSAITVEGFLSEHSIDLEPPADAGALYATAAGAWNADFDELTPLITVQVGFGSNVDLASFQRTPLNLCLVLDRSGSMDEDFDLRTRTTKLDAVRIAVDRLLAALTAQDRVSIVTFAEAPTLLLDPVPGNDLAAVKTALEGLTAEGATDLAAGMLGGYQLVQDNHDASRADRIMVFTDAKVTAGIRESEDFIAVMQTYAGNDIGATLVGVGVDFGQQLAYDISQVRGGNFVYLNDYDRIVQVFDEEFDFLVTPIAQDIRLSVNVPFALDIADVFGLPDVDTPSHTLEMLIPTLFYSTRQGGGAILIRLRPGASVDFGGAIDTGAITLVYETADGQENQETFHIILPAGLDPDAAEPYFQNMGTKRAVLLLNTALVLQNASRDAYTGYLHGDSDGFSDYHSPTGRDYDRAITRLTEFLPYFDALAAGLEDQPTSTSRSLSEERTLVERLLQNIRAIRSSRGR